MKLESLKKTLRAFQNKFNQMLLKIYNYMFCR